MAKKEKLPKPLPPWQWSIGFGTEWIYMVIVLLLLVATLYVYYTYIVRDVHRGVWNPDPCVNPWAIPSGSNPTTNNAPDSNCRSGTVYRSRTSRNRDCDRGSRTNDARYRSRYSRTRDNRYESRVEKVDRALRSRNSRPKGSISKSRNSITQRVFSKTQVTTSRDSSDY